MKTNGVRELGAKHRLNARQMAQLSEILAVLEQDEHAPTTVRVARRAVDVHLADSLVALELQSLKDAATITDLGSGVGFPGVALAVALPEVEVALVESQRRECEFLTRLCARAQIDNARVVRTRAEEWREGLSGSDVVVARALAAQPVVLEYAAPLLRLGGTLVDWRGKRIAADERAASRAAGELGLRLVDVRSVEPFVSATDRHLHQFIKAWPTPARFPRRAGTASKRPLGNGTAAEDE